MTTARYRKIVSNQHSSWPILCYKNLYCYKEGRKALANMLNLEDVLLLLDLQHTNRKKKARKKTHKGEYGKPKVTLFYDSVSQLDIFTCQKVISIWRFNLTFLPNQHCSGAEQAPSSCCKAEIHTSSTTHTTHVTILLWCTCERFHFLCWCSCCRLQQSRS